MSLSGGREAVLRLVAIASGVTIGVALLLFMVSGLRLLNGTLDRPCWRCTGQTTPLSGELEGVDPLHWNRQETVYNGRRISIYNIAQTGPNSPQIPGIAQLPGPDEYYVSPALAVLLAETPDDQLDDRFPGKAVGQIGRAGLDGPKELIAVVGHTPAELPLTPEGDSLPPDPNGYSYAVWKVQDQPQQRSFGPIISGLFLVGVAGLLCSVVTLIATATRLSASRREEKFAALRLFGATSKQINQLAAIDAALGAAVGAVFGLGLFYLLRPVFTKSLDAFQVIAFFPEDLRPGILGMIIVLVGVPLLAAGAAILSLRRVRISPLGVARKATPRPPKAWRLIPLAAGMIVVVGVWLANRDVADTAARAGLLKIFLAGFVLLLFGMVMAGPWLTMAMTRLLARRANSAAGLLGFRRLADNPKTAFRSVSVLVIAAFLSTFVAALAPQVLNPDKLSPFDRTQESPIIFDKYFGHEGEGMDKTVLQPVMAELDSIPGVKSVLGYRPQDAGEAADSMLISCADIHYVKQPSCGLGKTAVKVPIGFGSIFDQPVPGAAEQLSVPKSFDQQRVLKLMVAINGGQVAVDRVRTVFAGSTQLFGDSFFMTIPELRKEEREAANGLRTVLNGAFLVILFVAGCSLAVSVSGGLVERKRPFGLLRVTGVSLGQLRWVVFIESAVPLLSTVAISAFMGFGMAVFLVESFASKRASVGALPLDFYMILAVGTSIALLAMLATLPLLAAITKPENARFE